MSSDLFNLFIHNYAYGKSYLISAPTGSGKTHIAKYLLNKEERIIVYVSPLKALSREVYKAVREKRAKYVDSDVYEDDLRYFTHDALLTTYEKFDSSIRHSYRWLKEVRLLIVDEIHNVESDRGLPLENIVLWAKKNSVPVVALSATLSNTEDYLKWLNADLMKVDKRKVPLHECVAFPFIIKCYDNNRIIPIERRHLKNVKLDLLLGTLSYILSLGKNALVFVRSRSSAETLAETLRKFSIPALPYHSGLSYELRDNTINKFMSGEVKVLVSTTALGQGVNLPVYATVFYDISLPDSDDKGNFKGWRDLTVAEFKQIAGRAGRPSFDNEGMAIVITETIKEMEKVAKNYINTGNNKNQRGEEKVNFTLENLTLGVISWFESSKDELQELINSSFTFKNEKIDNSLDYLITQNLVSQENGVFKLTDLGKAVSLSYIDVSALKGFKLEGDFDPLDVVSTSPEVLQTLRGCTEGKELINRWANGEDITSLCMKLSAKDLEEVKSTARWISFALYRVLKALKHKKAGEAFELYERIKYGVSKEGLDLIKAGIGRDEVRKLIQQGVKSLDEACIMSDFLKVNLTVCKKFHQELREFVRQNYGKEIDKGDPRVEILRRFGIITEDYKWKIYENVEKKV
ncbi:MAG: DEAD/DEAH box helicase [Sulfolobus sp.]|nr:DEAD/DEAH box helicase [Sulfolobus sp.]